MLRAASAGVAVGLAFACAPILGIEDVSYGELEGGNVGDGSGGDGPGADGGFDAKIDCGTMTACSSGCADLTRDPNNCGKCEYACGATCTSSKCDERILANGIVFPHGIAVDDQFIYVTSYGTNGFIATDAGAILRIPLDGGTGQAIASEQDQPAFIVIRDGRLVWTNHASVASSLLDGGDRSSLPINSPGGVVFGIDKGDGDGVYTVGFSFSSLCPITRWSPGAGAASLELMVPCGRIVVRDQNLLYSTNANPAGGGVSVRAIDTPDAARPAIGSTTEPLWGMTQDDQYLYATGTSSIRRIAKDGGQETILADDAGLTGPRVIVADGTTLYVGDFGSNRIMRFANDGGAAEQVGAGGAPVGVAVSGNFLYWVNNGSGSLDGNVRRVRVK